MIKVNLLATTPGTAPARDWFPREQRSALIGLGMLMVTAVGVGGWWYYLSAVQTSIDGRMAAAEAQMVKLKEAAKLVEKTTARKKELTDRLAIIERLRAEKRGPVNLLETLSLNLPDGMWLLEIKQKGPSVQLEGRAMSLTAVTDFMQQMQNSGRFQRPVEILTTLTEVVEETTVVRFSIKADVVPPAAPAPIPPAASGTGADARAVVSAAPVAGGA